MELSCEIKVEDVLIGKDDLSTLFRRLEEIMLEAGKVDQQDKKYTLHFDNGTKISDNDFNILEKFPKQGKSRPIEIEASLTARDENFKGIAYISCEIQHGNKKWGKRFIVSSNEPSTFEHIKSCINNSIDSFEPQKNWFKNERLWGFGSLILQATMTFLLLDLTKYLAGIYSVSVEGHGISADIREGDLDLNFIFFFFALMWLPISSLMGKLQELAKENWPSVELNIGEEWQRKEAKRRSFAASMFAVIIFPIALLIISKY